MFHKIVSTFNDWIENWGTAAKEMAAVNPLTLLEHVRNLAPHGTNKLTECQAEARNRMLILIYESMGRKTRRNEFINNCLFIPVELSLIS